jgi:hypothetical protein
MKKDENTYLTACTVVVHSVGCTALGIYSEFVVPKPYTYWAHFLGGVEFSNAFLFVGHVSNSLRQCGFLLVLVVLGLLWLDAKIHSRLLHRKGLVHASLWAGAVSVILFVSLLFAACAMTPPQVPAEFYLTH